MTYTLKTAQFEGPFEALLDFIEREKLSINEIALARVAEGFFHYVYLLFNFRRRVAIT